MNVLARLAPGDLATRLVLGSVAQSTAVVLVAALLARVAFRRDPAVRHGLWLGALAWTLLSPAVTLLVDREGLSLGAVRLPIAAATAAAALDHREAPAVVGGSIAIADDRSPAGADAIGVADPSRLPSERMSPVGSKPSTSTASRRLAVAGGLGALWVAGVAVGLARLLAGWRRLSALVRPARPLDASRHATTLARVRELLGVDALPPVLTSTAAAGPAAVGLVRPRVVLPEGLAEAIEPDELRDVLLHECAHVVRRDPWVGLVQRLSGVLFWPHPPVHYLNAQLARAREEVCDNYALRHGEPCRYCRTLLTLTQLCQPPGAWRAGLGLLGARWTLTDRVAGLLDPRRVPMTRIPLRMRLALAAALATSGLVVASVRLDASAQGDGPRRAPQEPAGAATGAVWSVRGAVVDERGQPVAGVAVRLPGPSDPGDVAGGTTAADGTFTLELGGRHQFLRALVVEVDGGARVGLARFVPTLRYERPHDPVRIVVKPTVPVTVRVKDSAGAPVVGAAVAAGEEAYFLTGASTGPDGAAVLRLAADARIAWVTAHKSGVGFDYFENYTSQPATDFPPLPAELGLSLDGAQTVRIKAIDSEGRPVPGVRLVPRFIRKPGKVDSARPDYDPASWVATDDQGVAAFDWLPRSVPGFTFVVASGSYSAPEEVRYRQGGPTELTARLLRATRLSGTVRHADGRPAPGVLVKAQWSDPNARIETTRTGADGTYALEVAPERVYQVGVHDEESAAASHGGVVLREGQPRGGLDFRLVRGTLLLGRITEGPDRKPSPQAQAYLIEQGPVLPKEYRRGGVNSQLIRVSFADSEGNYRFRVAPGRYTLRAMGSAEQVAIEVAEQPEIVRDVALQGSTRRAFFGGVVVEKTPTGEQPVPGATIYSLRVGGYGGNSGRADKQGRFRTVRSPETVLYARGTGAGGAVAGFTAVPDGADDVKVIVAPAATVTGRVVDSDGRPQPRQRVIIQLDFGSNPSRSAHHRLAPETDERGRFTFEGFPVGIGGEVSVLHRKDGHPTGARTVVSFEVPALEPVELTDLVVPASATK